MGKQLRWSKDMIYEYDNVTMIYSLGVKKKI